VLEDAIGSHACSLEALACVWLIAFFLGYHCLITLNYGTPLKVGGVNRSLLILNSATALMTPHATDSGRR
jgi:hypothetical protein